MLRTGKFLTLFLSVSIFILLPFIYSIRLQDIEQSPRFLALAIIICISTLILIVSINKISFSIKRESFYIILLLFIAINIFAFTRSINFGDAFYELLKLLLFFILLFQLILLLSQDEKNQLLFFKCICISSLLFIGFGLSQLLTSFSKGSLVINYAISSTLGNKNFFSETLLLMFPVTLLSCVRLNGSWRAIAIASSILIFISVVVLQTLSTWIALTITGALVVMLLFFYRNKIFTNQQSSRVFNIAVVGIFISILLAVVFFFAVNGPSQLKARMNTIQNLLHPEKAEQLMIYQNSTYERLMLWKNSLLMIADHPLVGSGLANWKIFVPAYGMGSAKYMSSGGVRFVHPHNDFLLIASELGIIGLIIFLTLFIILIYYCFRRIKFATSSTSLITCVALLAGLLIYLLISLFSMPLNRFYPPIMLMLFIAMVLSFDETQTISKQYLNKKYLTFILIVCFCISATAVFIGYKRLRSDLNISTALLLERKGNYPAMKRQLETIDKRFFPLDATATPVTWYQGFACFYLNDVENAFKFFRKAEQQNPNHMMVINDLGTCYNLKGETEKAKAYYYKALHIQPIFDDALLNLAIVYYNQGLVDSSFTLIKKHSDRVKPSSVTVFNAILTAKAETLTSDTIQLNRFSKHLSSVKAIRKTLGSIRDNNGDLTAALKKY
jgi:O-antigen ligase